MINNDKNHGMNKWIKLMSYLLYISKVTEFLCSTMNNLCMSRYLINVIFTISLLVTIAIYKNAFYCVY